MLSCVNVTLTVGCIGVLISGASIAQPAPPPESPSFTQFESVRTRISGPSCQRFRTSECAPVPRSSHQRCRRYGVQCLWTRGDHSEWQCQEPILNWRLQGQRYYYSDVCRRWRTQQ
jgi:hypothetical protein